MTAQMESERHPVSREEADQLSRSTKKMKRVGDSSELESQANEDIATQAMVDVDMESAKNTAYVEREQDWTLPPSRRTYCDMVQHNNPNLNFTAMTNPMWEDTEGDVESGDDEPVMEDDPLCPTICLSSEEKKLLRSPWRNALILTTLDKGIGYMQLKRRLRLKWALKGDFSLIDIGCDYYVTRFTNMEDYEHVLTQGPWMLGDNYLVIREWIPNFVPEEDHITRLMAWVRIPRLSVEYFNKSFLLEKIGKKIGRVIRVDDTTANVERGQYTRLCVDVDLTKPLLSKFRLNGRVWRIQYEGLKMICFNCGTQGHKEDACPLKRDNHMEEMNTINSETISTGKSSTIRPEDDELYGSWMLVKKPARRRPFRQNNQPSNRTALSGGPNRVTPHQAHPYSDEDPQRIQDLPTTTNRELISGNLDSHGSRFSALASFGQDMATATLENVMQSPLPECGEQNLPTRSLPMDVSQQRVSAQVTTEAHSKSPAPRPGGPSSHPRQGLSQEPNRRQSHLDRNPHPDVRGPRAPPGTLMSPAVGATTHPRPTLDSRPGPSHQIPSLSRTHISRIPHPLGRVAATGTQNGDPPDWGDRPTIMGVGTPPPEVPRPNLSSPASMVDATLPH